MLHHLPVLALLALLGAGCSRPVDSGGDTGADSAGLTDTAAGDPLCADATPLTWETFGQGFLIEACDGCHAASAPDRHDAPEAVVFDEVGQAWDWRDRILARSYGEGATMPPQGGVTGDDRTRLYWWLGCGVPGT